MDGFEGFEAIRVPAGRAEDGTPIEWRAQGAREVTSAAVPAGHYIPEELPELTVREMRAFFGA